MVVDRISLGDELARFLSRRRHLQTIRRINAVKRQLLTVGPRHMRQAPRLRTGTAALVGRNGTVVERVTSDEGCVRIEGEIWTARPYDEDEVFEAGTRVQVLEIRGATALVAE